MSILLRLLLAHIIADFFLQTKWMVEGMEVREAFFAIAIIVGLLVK